MALVEAVALRVLELIDERTEAPARSLVDASTLAGALGVARSTIYEHADELGAVHVGGGSRPRLRFDVEQAREAWTRRSSSERSQAPQSPVVPGLRRRRQPDRLGSGGHLLPIRGESDGRRAG